MLLPYRLTLEQQLQSGEKDQASQCLPVALLDALCRLTMPLPASGDMERLWPVVAMWPLYLRERRRAWEHGASRCATRVSEPAARKQAEARQVRVSVPRAPRSLASSLSLASTQDPFALT